MKKLIGLLRHKIYIVLFFCLVLLFFYPFIFFGKIPIPADTIVGMYHPFRDVVWDKFTQGVPFKNFLITDPVRQQYVWRNLVIEQLKKGQFPLWNPYSFSGTPLLANFQSAVFYPLNLLFFILPFNFAWGILILLQPLLSGIFLYLYLREMKLNKFAGFIAGFTFAFSGFSIVWLEWNTIGHTILWLPLILLLKEKLLKKFDLKIAIIFFLAGSSSILAGHLQVLFYILIISNVYLFIRIIHLAFHQKKFGILQYVWNKYIPFLILGISIFTVTSPVWLPALKFINLSARGIDQSSFLQPGWFIPWQNILQFVVPDFFGNPATGNYYGIWNYAEFVGYIGIIPLILALYALLFRFDKRTLVFGSIFFLGLLFSLPTPVAYIPYIFKIPFISTSQPTRLLSIICLSLAILAGLGLEKYQRDKNIKKILFASLIPCLILIIGWFIAILWRQVGLKEEYAFIARKNLILPSLLLSTSILLFVIQTRLISRYTALLNYLLALLLVFDLFRFGWKFTPFSPPQWIFPSTKILEVIAGENKYSRFMSLDRRIMPANFSVYYKIQDVSGYDPLYLYLYNQLASSWDKNKADLTPASFNRIITPMNTDSIITDLLGVEYVVSFGPSKYPWLELVIIEGQTYLYRNKNAFPRAFFVDEVLSVTDKQEELEKMFFLKEKLRNTAVTSEKININPSIHSPNNTVSITDYTDNMIALQSNSEDEKLLVLTDIYYPNWQVFIDGKKAKIIRVDFALRGVIVPRGEHKIEFRINLI